MAKHNLLLHACCGPCSSLVWTQLLDDYSSVSAFFFNPNIQPDTEYQLRLQAMKTVSEHIGAPLIHDSAGSMEWSALIAGLDEEPEGGLRCQSCIRFRMQRTFKTAVDMGFHSVSTTLTVGRHKNSKMILSIGRELSEQYGVLFYNRDFKKNNGSYLSIKLAKEWGLYCQDYCGCLSSKTERNKRFNR